MIYAENPREEGPSVNREHKVYANLENRPNCFGIEEFISLGTTRIGKFTQLCVLMENLQHRKIAVDVFHKKYNYILEIVVRSVSQLTSTECLDEGKENDLNFREGIREAIG